MNRARKRLVAVLLVLGLTALAGCGSTSPAGSVVAETAPLAAPEGTILFTRIRTDGKPALFTIAADGSHQRLFVTRAAAAAVSWDGQQILFVRRGAIWLMSRDGSGQRQVTRPPRTGSDYGPAWSPSGSFLYFSRQIGLSSSRAFSIGVDGTSLRRLTRGCGDCLAGGDDELAPSPDGRLVAYSSWGHGGGDDWSFIEAMTPSGREAKLGFRTTEASHEWSPAWAPDGERLAFAALDAGAYDMNHVGLTGIYVSTRRGPARRVFRPDRHPYVQAPAWSADGKWIVFTYLRTDKDSDVWLVPADGGPAQPVTSGRAYDLAPTWLPPSAGP